MNYLFNDGWSFTQQEIFTPLEAINQRDIKWSAVDIPHDWLIYNMQDLYETGEGWYRKHFTVEDMENKVICLYFEGVYMDSAVYINDAAVGEWKYGYTSFEFDITKYLHPGENEIKVRVTYQSLNTRWYSGAGIYRNVWLKILNQAHFITDGIYIATQKEKDGWLVEIDSELIEENHKNSRAMLRTSIMDRQGRVAASREDKLTLTADKTREKQSIFLEDIREWSLEEPYLYQLKSELILEDETVDSVVQSFGFRTLLFDREEGFFLNGKYTKIHGACQHHDLGALGAAVNKEAIRRQIELLKKMGVNAIRTSHNIPAVELMDLADEAGILIVSEAFDMWERPKTEFDYARYFNEWCERDVASWIRRDRNHPSIIMWSIGNEIYDTHADERGLEITRRLRDLVLLHDPKNNGVITIGSNFMAGENAQKCADELRIAGYNYGEALYEEHHKKYPDWVIYGSETASTLQSRGIYHFPADKTVVTHEDEQCSSLGNCSTSWGAKNTQKNITDDRDAKYCLGQFIWSGFDYIGEPTPYFTKNSYFGQLDTAGFKKDSYYIYQAEWTDYKTNPMVHILPYWDFNEGQLIDIRIYSNAPKTELFVNEISMGIFEADHKKGIQLSGEWQVPYQKGCIRAVAYDEMNTIVAVDEQRSFGDAAQIVINPDKTVMKTNGMDMIFIEISMTDEKGVPVANANNRVEVEVTGAGRLVGLDNGDSTDYEAYKGTSRRLFSGKLLAMVAAKEEPGIIQFKVSSEGMKPEEIIFHSLEDERIRGVSALTENRKSDSIKEIPIRKIELKNHGKGALTQENRSVKVTARILPDNATYKDIEWKAITANGIITNIAEIEAQGTEAVITALGDGEFRLRCTANNGCKVPGIVSELEFEITGLGEAALNPYEFVSAGLYNSSNTEIHSGLSGGVSTENTQNYIGFKGVDFGDYGSDELRIPIYYLGNDPFEIEIWEGMPEEENASLLLKTIYHKDFIWNTYQPEIFKLPRRLKGISTLCIGVKIKLDIQGFQFKKYEKAYEIIEVKDNSQIYGDSYNITKDAIENIGNNVVLEFENMDFGQEGLDSIVLFGRSPIDINTVHIQFDKDSHCEKQLVEIPFSEEYEKHEFKLKNITGCNKVSFIFLPGSKFDFKWFQFQRKN
ncbi:beta-galactosidase [Anaerocolumna jejuensis DSM 15929]|uniref:Beta-galactosidase n=1 Tax=Anaerocolumna jejuensis DSM 15929 TaxID=1121322 RepID=A0A1M6L1V0_9FIRM|nr:glycoside hydrolase family 2 TIM barrel-domain containing protein [Anaerocolumna jejuensis]SHJ65082.1 beta-galactosidase [Anaerocolumna jejuensis DSM 15929]